MGRPRSPREGGQAAIFTILCLTSLIGAVALVIDVGIWRAERGEMINAADAAALAAVAYLPADAGKATGIAHTTAGVNGASSADVKLLQTQAGSSGLDTVVVTVHSPGKPYFARLFGIGDFDISYTSTARVQAYVSVSERQVFPIGITPDAIPSTGEETSLKFGGGSGSTGNYGAIQLPYEENGCATGAGASTWRDLMGGQTTPCRINVNDTLPVETGNMSGPTDQGLDQRIGSNADTFEGVVRLDPNGGPATILQPDSPRLVAVPIVVNADTGESSFPNGSKDVRIVGFAYFFVTSWGGGEVHGIFVQALADLDEELGGVTQTSQIRDVSLIKNL